MQDTSMDALYQMFINYQFTYACRLQAGHPHQRNSAHCPLCMLHCVGIHWNHLCSCMHGIHYCVQKKNVSEQELVRAHLS